MLRLLGDAHSARAEEKRKGAPREAVEHYERGQALFRAGRYRDAIIELKAALALDPESPNLMYNVAYTSELLGDLSQAMLYYRRYLSALPRSQQAERSRTEQTLKRLEGHRRQVAAEAAPSSGGLKAPLRSSAGTSGIETADTLFWVTLGSGVAALAAGGVTGVMALDREDTVADFVAGVEHDGSLSDRQALIDEANNLALTSDILIVSGAALVVTAAGLLFLRGSDERSPEDKGGIELTPGLGSLALRATW